MRAFAFAFNGTYLYFGGKFANIKIDSNFVFKLSVDGVDYRFVPSVSRVVNRSQDPIDIGNGQFRHIYEIFDLEVIQGSLVTESYIVDTSDVNQRFLISIKHCLIQLIAFTIVLIWIHYGMLTKRCIAFYY